MHTVGFALMLVLRIYDMAGVSSLDIATAERTTAVLLGRAHIQVSWIACPAAPRSSRDERCGERPAVSELVLRIVAASGQPANAALGDSYIDRETDAGFFATIYVNRVSGLAAASGVDPGILMGRAIAHEIGHLLLGTSSHSAAGLMRPVWSASMLRRDGAWAWTFSQQESARLRRKLDRRLALASSAVQANLIAPFPPSKPCPKLRELACASDVGLDVSEDLGRTLSGPALPAYSGGGPDKRLTRGRRP